jgi:hypothetical protein
MPLSRLLAAFSLVAVAASLPAQDKPAADDGFKPLFNGTDLSGWVNVNCHPGTFFVKDGAIVTTGKPTGFLRTDRQYENFVLEMDWMHTNTKEVGNSGLFVWGDPLPAVGTGYTRGIEVQVLVNLEYKDKMGRVTATSHGDLFSIWGATCVPDRPHPLGWARCLPSENRAKGGGEWNHYKVTANDGVIKLEVNGKEVSGVSKCNPRKGYLALESEDAECHFKNIRIKELPSTNPKPEECAKADEGFESLFNGLDLKGWKETVIVPGYVWKVSDGRLIPMFPTGPLVSDRKAGRGELMFDWKPGDKQAMAIANLGPVGVGVTREGGVSCEWKDEFRAPPTSGWAKKMNPTGWNRVVMAFDGETVVVRVNGDEVVRAKVDGAKPRESISVMGGFGESEFRNIFFREPKKEEKK